MIKIEIETTNAAFEDFEHEIQKVIDQAKKKISLGNGCYSLKDSNGNRVGYIEIFDFIISK